jgi:hypothetical protein
MNLEKALGLYDEKKYKEAFEIFSELALYHADAEAQYFLGRMYCDGDGVEENFEKAAYWWKKARQQGHRDAAFALSEYQTSTKNMF